MTCLNITRKVTDDSKEHCNLFSFSTHNIPFLDLLMTVTHGFFFLSEQLIHALNK